MTLTADLPPVATAPARARSLSARFRPRVGDLLLSAALFGETLLSATALVDRPPGRWPLLIALAVLLTFPALWRRTAPVAMLAVHLVWQPITFVTGLPIGGLACLVLLYSVGAYRPWRMSLLVLAGTVAVTPPMLAVFADQVAGAVVLQIGWQLVAAWALGVAVGLVRSRTRQHDERRQQDRLNALLAAARARIGSELHEVVEQRMHRVVDRAAALAARSAGAEPPTGQLLEIQRDARETMTAMRRMLGLLRSTGPTADLPPLPAAAAEEVTDPRRPLLADVALTVAVLTAAVLLHVVLPSTPPEGQEPGVWMLLRRLPASAAGLLVFLAQVAPLAWRRSAPTAALVVCTVATLLSPLVAMDSLAGAITLSVLVYSVAAWSRRRIATAAIVFATAGWLVAFTLLPPPDSDSVSPTAANVGYGFLATGAL